MNNANAPSDKTALLLKSINLQTAAFFTQDLQPICNFTEGFSLLSVQQLLMLLYCLYGISVGLTGSVYK